jgi:hypothetical protein
MPDIEHHSNQSPATTCVISQTLHHLAQQGTPVCFYASFGHDWATLDQIPERHAIVCDYIRYREMFETATRYGRKIVHETDAGAVFRTPEGKLTIYLQLENAHAVRWMRKLGIQVSSFVGLQDGCQEGGNYECVNDMWFLRDILSIAALPLRYYTNHFIKGIHCDEHSTFSGNLWWADMGMGAARAPCHPLEWANPSELHRGWFLGSRRFAMRTRLLLTLRCRGRRVPCIEIDDTRPTILVGSIGGVEVSIERDNMASGLLEVDGYFGTRGAQQQLAFYGVLSDRAYIVDGLSHRPSHDITSEFLSIADQHGMQTIASMPFGNGDHRGLVRALHEYGAHGNGSVKKLRLMHLDEGDFADIRELFRPEVQRAPPPTSPPRRIPNRKPIRHALPLDLA